MIDTFYIVENKGWYQLCVKDTHFCISCGSDLSKLLRVVKKYTKQYKTVDKLLRALSRLDGGGKVSPSVFNQREEWYRSHGKDYYDLIKKTVNEAVKESREEEKSTFQEVQSRLKRAGIKNKTDKTVGHSIGVIKNKKSAEGKETREKVNNDERRGLIKPHVIKMR